mgnify:CR=1 FL=1
MQVKIEFESHVASAECLLWPFTWSCPASKILSTRSLMGCSGIRIPGPSTTNYSFLSLKNLDTEKLTDFLDCHCISAVGMGMETNR